MTPSGTDTRVQEFVGGLVATFEQFSDAQPLVQCITNGVVMNFTANALLAAGAAPSMVDIPTEAGAFAAVADALLINLGTPHEEQRAAAVEAARAAGRSMTPWVLDPVAIGALEVRTQLAHDLVALRPTAIRGNASEIRVLAGVGSGGRGVESTDSVADTRDEAERLARKIGAIVAVSGKEDLITDGRTSVLVAAGSEMLTTVTGAGCTLGALVAALCAPVEADSRLAAVAAAHLGYGIAAERAAEDAPGPGSFAVRLIDELSRLRPEDLRAPERLTITQAGE